MTMRNVFIGLVVLLLLISSLPTLTPFKAQEITPEPIPESTSQPDGTLRRIHVPILMYHYISPLPEDADVYRIDLTVEPEIFATHLEYLRDNDYQTISLYELHNALLYGAELPPKPIILTFDDGHLDHYTHAFPMLQTFGFSATFFVITGLADRNHPDYITWEHIREMANAGMHMQPHTKTHIDLRERDNDRLIYEILGSVESLEAHTQQTARVFAYPAGRYDDNTLAIVDALNIQRAVTTQFGAYHTTDNMLEVSRLRVTGNMSAAGLAQLLASSR